MLRKRLRTDRNERRRQNEAGFDDAHDLTDIDKVCNVTHRDYMAELDFARRWR